MENCSTNLDIHERMGTTQDQRLLAALHSHYFLIDERKEVDYIEFAQKLSQFIMFFNDSNTKNGDWSTFFQWESTSILVNLFLWDINKILEDYKVVKEKIKLLNDPDDNVIQEAAKLELFSFFTKIKLQFEKFNTKIAQLDDAIVAKSYLMDTAYLIINPQVTDCSDDPKIQKGALQEILCAIRKSSLAEDPIKGLISKYQFDKNVQKLIGLLFNWKQVSGESVENQLKNYASHAPHYALFLAFLKQLGVAKDHLNQFTKIHLDFYYKDILKIKPIDGAPDYVNLILETVAQSKGLLLPKGSVFQAGKNALGKNKFYASTADVAVNAIRLDHFKSTFFYKNDRSHADFIELNATNTSFDVFKDEATVTETGFLIASPLFFLNGGDRYLMVKLNGVDIDTTAYRFYITAENKSIEISTKILPNDTTNNASETTQTDRLYLFIPASEKKIIAHDPKIHTEINVTTPYPVLKIVSKNNNQELEKINQLGIEVKVRNCKNFILATDTGTVDITKPFVPFGDFPKNGNGFSIGFNEFASKKNATLRIKSNLTIENKAKGKVNGYRIMKLHNGLWEPATDDEASRNVILSTNYITDYSLEDSIPTNESVAGYYRIELDAGESYEGEKFLNDFITQSRTEGGVLKTVPRIDWIVMDYDVEDVSYSNPIDIFQIMPFGYKQLNRLGTNNKYTIDAFEDQVEVNKGEIYLGFDEAEIGNSLNLLVQLSEGSSNPLKEPAVLEWYFLKNQNNWEIIKETELGDETDGLMQSGLLHYTIPEFDTSQTTVLPANKFWFKIKVSETDAICQFIGVHTQAFKAVLTDFENNGSQFIEHTEKETITKLYEPLPFVKKVTQPYVSFGGKLKEDDNLLYQRTSERLRHKNRAITAWDYERLILQKFPNVYRIKCLNHYRYDTFPPSKIAAGYITLIPIGKSNSKQENITWKPLVSQDTMNKIRQYVSEIGSPHARVMVKQPKLETIVLKFNVKYHDVPGADVRLYGTKLKDTINKYLSPWSFGENEVQFANSVEIASIIQLIDDQPFVDFITDFEVTHYYIDENGKLCPLNNVKKIIPHSDYTLFVPPTLFSFPTTIRKNTIRTKNLLGKQTVSKISADNIPILVDKQLQAETANQVQKVMYDHAIKPLPKDNNCY